MPNYFAFLKPDAEEPTSQGEVEREFLADLGLEDQIQDEWWHPAFEVVRTAAALLGDNEDKVDRWLQACQEQDGMDARRAEVTRSYLVGPKYRVQAWFQVK